MQQRKSKSEDGNALDINITQKQKHIMALERIVRAKKSKDSLIDFCQFTTPDANDPNDSSISAYQVKKHHQVLAAALEEVAAGRIRRLIVSMPPRHGKTEECCVKFIPWYVGKYKGRHAIYGTYNENIAKDKGNEVKEVMSSAAYSQVFPDCQLVKGGKASGRMRTVNRNSVFFVGRGGAITGRGGDIIVIDDLFKNDEEADSPAMREKVWKWFIGTVMNRFMTDKGAIVLVMTRWHEDDVIGRIIDPENPYYDSERAKEWSVINIPAEAEEGDLLGRQPGEALWPERFGLPYLQEQKGLDSRRYSCLYQGNPTPEQGVFFLRNMVKRYNPEKLDTKFLRKYGACDLSVGTKEQKRGGKVADRSALIIFGVDVNDNIYLLDAMINRDKSDKNVENIIDLMLRHNPMQWFTYQDQITGSVGPFLFKRMRERRANCYVSEHSSATSKEQKAQSFRARMAMGMVFFPTNRQWATEIIEELIRFPGGKNDDCVDTCALFGQEIDKVLTGKSTPDTMPDEPTIGSIAWIIHSDKLRKALEGKEDKGGF